MLEPQPVIAVPSQHRTDGKSSGFMDDLGMNWIFWDLFMLRYKALRSFPLFRTLTIIYNIVPLPWRYVVTSISFTVLDNPIIELKSRFSRGLALAILQPNAPSDIIELAGSYYRPLSTRARTQPTKDLSLEPEFSLLTRLPGYPGHPSRPINCSRTPMQCFCH